MKQRLDSLETLVACLSQKQTEVPTPPPDNSTTELHAGRETSAEFGSHRIALYNEIETGSMESWSADAAGKGVAPGPYHTNRKAILGERLRRQRKAPKGCFNSFAKYLDEANRIYDTGRIAF